ncbi:MAG TPA: SymE family type I addiction module toxin [Thermoanaerobaculia bacterium]|nr:SymE family type I addiction module toxin [Thermoanaerobaculia bacterium]
MRKQYTVSYRRYEGTSPMAPEWKKRHRRPESFHPLIRLSGRWLEGLGFPLGGKIEVEAEPGRLVLKAVPGYGSSELAAEVCEPKGEG